jgi:hypothetical protein
VIVGYELGISSIAAAAAAAGAEFQSNAVRRAKLRETGMFSQAATAARIVLGRPGNTPTGGAVTIGGAQDPAEAAATAGVTTTWTVAPTVPAPVMRQIDFGATAGSGVIWTWPADGELALGLTRAGSLVYFNPSGSPGTWPILSLYLTWGE